MVSKQGTSWRPCGDYRWLNAATVDDRYSIPRIQNFNSSLVEMKVFSKIDLIGGYHQIPVTTLYYEYGAYYAFRALGVPADAIWT